MDKTAHDMVLHSNTTSIEENFNCESIPKIQLAFNYQDSLYQISDPSHQGF